MPIADWAAKNGIKKVVTFVADYGPGLDAEKFFKSQFQLNGGQIIGEIRSPLRSPDFAPFLQKVADLKPDAVFCFLPSGQGAAFMKQFGERGLDKSGIKLIATGDVTDDDQLNEMGDVALGVVNSHHYSAAHPSAANKKFVAGVRGGQQVPPQLHGGRRLRRHARDLQARSRRPRAQGGGDALLAAMKGQVFESPRGPVLIDAQTRDIVQDVYIRKVERAERPALQRRVRRAEGGQGPGEDRSDGGGAAARAALSARRRRRAPGSARRRAPVPKRRAIASAATSVASARRAGPARLDLAAQRRALAVGDRGMARRRRAAARRDGVDLRGRGEAAVAQVALRSPRVVVAVRRARHEARRIGGEQRRERVASRRRRTRCPRSGPRR